MPCCGGAGVAAGGAPVPWRGPGTRRGGGRLRGRAWTGTGRGSGPAASPAVEAASAAETHPASGCGREGPGGLADPRAEAAPWGRGHVPAVFGALARPWRGSVLCREFAFPSAPPKREAAVSCGSLIPGHPRPCQGQGRRKEVCQASLSPSSPIAWPRAGRCFGNAKYGWSVRLGFMGPFPAPVPLFLCSGGATDAKGSPVFTKEDVRFPVVLSHCWPFFRDLAPVL